MLNQYGFVINENVGFDKEENPSLWRYIGIHKLINLIETKSLPLIRLDKFEDPLEGISEENLLRHRISEYANDLDKTGELKTVLDNSFRRKSSLTQKSQFISCWFISERESVAMWKLYSNPDGVCVKTKLKDISQTILNNAHDNLKPHDIISVTYGKVAYKDFLEPKSGRPNNDFKKDVKHESLRKDVSFGHENEFRIIAELPTHKINEELIGIPLDVKELFPSKVQVICHPLMEEWKIQNIKTLCTKHGIDVRISELRLKG